MGEDKGGGGAPHRSKIKFYTRETLRRSRQLRSDSTKAERKLWRYLRQRQLDGLKFRRQYIIGFYITDFACVEKRVVVELDGGQHALQSEYDARREAFLRRKGYAVLRLWNNEVLENIEGVREIIRHYCS